MGLFYMKKLLLSLLLLASSALPAAAQVIAYKDAQGNIYFEGLPLRPQRLGIYYSAGSIKYQGVWMAREEPSRATCPVHVIWQSKKSKFVLTSNITILAATGNLQFNYRNLPSAPFNGNPCTLPNNLWQTIAPGVEATEMFKDRWSYKLGSQTKYKAARTIYIRGLPGSTYRVINEEQKSRFMISNACGFVKLANSDKWTADLNDQFSLYNDQIGQFIGTYTRSLLPLRTITQIPKCFDGKRFIYQP